LAAGNFPVVSTSHGPGNKKDFRTTDKKFRNGCDFTCNCGHQYK